MKPLSVAAAQDTATAGNAGNEPLAGSIAVLITVTLATLTALGIDPAKASKEEIAAALERKVADPSVSDDEGTEAAQLAELQAQLATANAKLAEIAAADAAEEFAEYELDPAVLATLSAMPTEQRAPILALLPKKAAGATATAAADVTGAVASTQVAGTADAKKMPPAPIHNTQAQAAPSAADKAAEQAKLIKTIQAAQGSKFKDYTSAREEARRQRAELFA